MYVIFIRYLFIIICSIYIYYNILNIKNNFYLVISMLFSLIISLTINFFIPLPNSVLCRVIASIFFSYLFVTAITRVNILLSLETIFISYGLCYIFLTFSSIISGIMFYAIYKKSEYIQDIPFLIFIGIMQFFLSVSFFKLPRFKKGILLLVKNQKAKLGIIVSLFLVLYIISFSHNVNEINLNIKSIIILSSLILSVFILYYWRHRITQTYLENMRRLETLNYENTIADKDKHIKELEETNAYLGRIIHKYRKIIPAMEMSVMELLQNNEELDSTELRHKAESLQIQLDEIHAERDNLFDNYQKQTIASTQTGLHTVDAMLALMEKRAKQDWIRYKMQIAQDIKELSLMSIKETDLLHLLGDLIENAIHAVNATDTKDILIHIGKLNNCLLLEVSDSGIAFDIQTYQHFGNESYTTHTENGGTGTGLMDIWSIKKKYKASLYIYEYETSSNNIFTKKISFLFDGKNHFLLKTYRDKEIKNSLIRGDLHVFPHETE